MDEAIKKESTAAKRRIDRIKLWFKNPYNLAIVIIISLAAIYKLYWFFKLGNQPLWWDEADYMNIARSWAGGAFWAFNPLRPILLPLIGFLFIKIGLGETSIRLLMLLISIGSIYMIYAVGKTFFDKKTGLIAAFILSIFWSYNFYSFRILVDIPVMFLWLATIYFFFDAYFEDKSWKRFAIAGVLLGLAFLMKFSTVALIGAMGLYLLTTEKLGLLKNKKVIIFWAVSFITVLPYFIWQYVVYKSPIAFYIAARGTVTLVRSFFQSLYDQTKFSVSLMHSALVVLFILGAILLIGQIVLLYDNIGVKKTKTNKYFFIFLWLAVALIFFGYLNYGDAMDERYYFIFYTAMFLIAANVLIFAYEHIKKYSKEIAFGLIIIVLALAAYQNITQANQTIEIKKDSFIQPKEAGLWLREHTQPEEKVLTTQTHAELQYSAERTMVGTGESNSTQAIYDYAIKNGINYAVLSIYYPQNTKEYEYNFFFNNPKLEIEQAYGPYLDKNNTIPLLTIFRIIKNESQSA